MDSGRKGRCQKCEQLALVSMRCPVNVGVLFINGLWSFYCLYTFPLRRTERDASAWSTEKIKNLLLAVKFEGPEGNHLHLSCIAPLT